MSRGKSRVDCYVYAHLNPEGEIFYIGKGVDRRAWSLSGRSELWRSMSSSGYSVSMICTGMNDESSLELERLLIAELRESGLKLANLNAGGQGATGYVPSEENRRRASELRLGVPQSPEHAAKSRLSRVGKTNSQSHRDATGAAKSVKVIDSNGRIYKSVMQASRDLTLLLGKKCYQGLISMCARGERNNAYSLSWSYDLDSTPKFKPTNLQERRVKNCDGTVFKSVQAAKDWVISMRGAANNQCISASARSNGKLKAYGYQWSYIE